MKTNTLESPIMGMIDGRFVRIDINVTDLGSQDAIIKEMSDSMATNIVNAFMLPGGSVVGIQSRGTSVIAWTEIKMLRLATVWATARNGSTYPLFKHTPDSHEIEAAMMWDPLVASMRLFFTSTYIPGPVGYRWQASYLIAKFPQRKEIFRPPLPNIFSDSKLCLGNDYSHDNKCLDDAFNHSLEHFHSSKWNNDAMEGLSGDQIKALYTFDKAGKQVEPPKDFKWIDSQSCHAVNVTNHYGELPIV